MTRRTILLLTFLALIASGCSEPGNESSASIATIGGAAENTLAETETTDSAPADDEAAPAADEAIGNEPVTETPQATVPPAEPVAQPPDLNGGLGLVGYGEQSGVPVASCTGTEPGWETRRVINVDDYLNIRNSPGGEIIMRLAPGFETFALVNSSAGSVDASKRPQILDGDVWVLIELPGPGPFEEPAQYGCGWAHGGFVSSPNGGTFASNYLGSDAVTSVGSARCSAGSDLVFGGSNGNVSFAFCANSAGTMEYHGVDLSNGNDIRLAACQWVDDVYVADNGGYIYEGIDERGTSANSKLYIANPDGEIILDEVFPVASGSTGVGRSLRSC